MRPSLYHSLVLMMHRSYLNQSRQLLQISTRVTQGLFYALILCAFYAPTLHSQEYIQNRIGNLYELTALTFIGMLNCVALFPPDRDVFFREFVDGGFSPLAFFLTYFTFTIPFIIFSAIAISALIAFAVSLQPTSGAFLLFVYVTFSFMLVGECIGVMFCSLFQHVGVSANITSLVISVFTMMAGFISINMSTTLTYLNYMSPIKWGSWIISNAVFREATFTCSEAERLASGECPYSSGDQVLRLYNMYVEDYEASLRTRLWILAVICVAFMVAAFIVLRIKAESLLR